MPKIQYSTTEQYGFDQWKETLEILQSSDIYRKNLNDVKSWQKADRKNCHQVCLLSPGSLKCLSCQRITVRFNRQRDINSQIHLQLGVKKWIEPWHLHVLAEGQAVN